jgi:hypothetical protein
MKISKSRIWYELIIILDNAEPIRYRIPANKQLSFFWRNVEDAGIKEIAVIARGEPR